MNRFVFLALVACLLFVAPLSTAVAAPAKIPIIVKVDASDIFWNSAYYTSQEKTPARPAEIKLEWSVGDFGKPAVVSLVRTNKEEGHFTIEAEKGAVVNIRIFAVSAKGETVASWNMQFLNKGQTETITITPPASVQPEFNRS